MASRATDSMDLRKSLRDLIERECGYLISFTKQMKEEIQANRIVQIQEKLDRNRRKLQAHIHRILPANNRSCDVPLSGTERALCVLNGFHPGSADKDFPNIHEVAFTKTNLLPFCPGIPKYLTWVFLRRNQRMAEDQSVVGRRRIYYDQSGNEALICSDSEDDFPEGEEEKRDFSEAEDRILLEAYSRMDSRKHILDADVADVVSHSIGATPAEIKERYKELKLKGKEPQESSSEKNMSLEKSLSAVLDSFDNLFCRRCLVFDCRLHGCSQNLVYPSEKQFSLFEPEDGKPCSDQCYLLAGQTSGALVQGSNMRPLHQMDHNAAVGIARNLDAAAGEGCSAAFSSASAFVTIAQQENVAKRKLADDNDKELEVSKSFGDSIHKKSLETQAIEPTTAVAEVVSATAIPSAKIRKLSIETCQSMDTQVACKHPLEGHTTSVLTDVSSQKTSSPWGCQVVGDEVDEISGSVELKHPAVSLGGKNISLSSNCEWKPLEKDLYMKGLEIFGRNSCLIARNLLSGLKTCSEISFYMRDSRALMAHEMDIVRSEDDARAHNDNKEQEVLVRSRSRLVRKKGRSRRFKYSTKSNGQPSSWKSIGDGDQSCKQYTPCDCKLMCGKECPCLKRGTCCEKYCGCSKGCKNRFRGCHCAKSQCRSRQCPCFAANRECDPDVCRNCWVSCGGGPLGEPPKKGDGQCGNMRLLLRQQQRILLGISDVAGWGAFIKNTVNKHDYLGEYTGELISHREADKRGKIYDRANSSFLFDLNDEYVLDACRHGDKLKFANHSSNPNCYCKVMLVAGDHRVGIFSKERIEAGEELFYDYRYRPDQAPAWARISGALKKDDHLPSHSRARKHQSR